MQGCAVSCDPWAQQTFLPSVGPALLAPLKRQGVRAPDFLVADLGTLLRYPQADLRPGREVSRRYVELLRGLRDDIAFRTCCKLIEYASTAEQQTEAVATAVARMLRTLKSREIPSRETVETWLESTAELRKKNHWLTALDLIAVRAVARTRNGDVLLDNQQINACVRHWDPIARHRFTARHLPTPVAGTTDVSNQPGDLYGYTGVRPRLPTDELSDILTSHWGLTQHNWTVGLDRILNRDTEVFSRESPRALVPRLRVLVSLVADIDSGICRGVEQEAERLARCRQLALLYRMILDATDQVPADLMTVDVALHAFDFGDLRGYATGFNLQTAGLTTRAWDNAFQFDELAPFYFCRSRFDKERPAVENMCGDPGLAPLPDPFDNLRTAYSGGENYAAVLMVIAALPTRWGKVFQNTAVPLRAMDKGRACVLLFEADRGQGQDERGYRFACYRSLDEAARRHAGALRNSSDMEVRDAFLDMLIGPARTGRENTLRYSPGTGNESKPARADVGA